MKLPFFEPSDDPGASFTDLVAAIGNVPGQPLSVPGTGAPGAPLDESLMPPHGTTCCAIRFDGGVVIAGDRRATSGNLISHRDIEKVFATDRHSSVAIAGAAGPAVEMVRLFQLQLEHYEKVEGRSLSLDGKANQLSQMLRSNLPMAMQGMAVVPIFAGFDLRRDIGRLFQFDVTGGRYEERDYAVTGSGMLHAGTVIKVGWHNDQGRDDAVDLAIEALYQAADSDSASGLPDFLREIYPVVATITESGYERVSDEELAGRYDTLIAGLRERGIPS